MVNMSRMQSRNRELEHNVVARAEPTKIFTCRKPASVTTIRSMVTIIVDGTKIYTSALYACK